MYSLKVTRDDAVDFVIKNTATVKKLLEDKGFGYDKKDLSKRIALLHTEASELIDAVKKGKGLDAEGEETADIAIRVLNLPCMSPEILGVGILDKRVNKEINITYNIDNILDLKYDFVNDLHVIIGQIGSQSKQYLVTGEQRLLAKNNKEFEQIQAFRSDILFQLSCNILSVISLCFFYINCVMPDRKLQEFIDSKISKNYERPYRYGTSEEHFKG